MNIEKEYIENVDDLPPCPEIALDVLRIAQDEECDFEKLSAKIEMDPNLTANMLRMANSVVFGYMRKISSVKDIIVRLGLENVKLIAITSASVALLRPSKKAYGLGDGALWRHSYATAVLASIIGKHAAIANRSTLYTAALLHDIGKAVLDQPLQREVLDRELPDREMDFVEYEDFILHTNHAKVGMALLESWGLPEDICMPVGSHHVREWQGNDGDLTAKIVFLANLLIENMGILLTDTEKYNFALSEQENHVEMIHGVPNFAEKKELIIDEFFDQYSDGLSFI
jgi:putative nucleotidyltransferase with HDIG domain